MSTLNLHETLQTSSPQATVDRLQEFYTANGYDFGMADRSDDTTSMIRGESGSSWWSSNMTELPCEVRLVARDASVEIHYEVDVSGQYITDEDRTFWDNELEKAIAYGSSQLETPTDLRKAEENRAEKGFGERIAMGVWGAIIIAVFIMLLGFLGVI
ncbi:MAG: hypothetical protein ACQEVA_09190 [Myxococcota bacterium]